MLNAIVENLINIGWAMLIFLAAYLANVAFSLWYNIKIQHQSFDKNKIIASALKILTFVVGLTLLCVAITTLPLFATQVGWVIPEEYTDIFADIVIIGAVLRVSCKYFTDIFADIVITGAVLLVSCKYIKEAYEKFVAILNTAKIIDEEGTDNE